MTQGHCLSRLVTNLAEARIIICGIHVWIAILKKKKPVLPSFISKYADIIYVRSEASLLKSLLVSFQFCKFPDTLYLIPIY